MEILKRSSLNEGEFAGFNEHRLVYEPKSLDSKKTMIVTGRVGVTLSTTSLMPTLCHTAKHAYTVTIGLMLSL